MILLNNGNFAEVRGAEGLNFVVRSRLLTLEVVGRKTGNHKPLPFVLLVAYNAISTPALPSHVTVEDEQEGLKRTAHLAQEIHRLRRMLELPPEMGHVVLDLYVQQARSVALEREARESAARTERRPLPIRSRKGNDTGHFRDGHFVPGESADDDRVKPERGPGRRRPSAVPRVQD